MKIETKYDIGQEVYCQTRTGVGYAKIYSIEIYSTCLMYYLEGEDIEGWYFEYELFPTKEQLLKSL